jgi:hypothetical protein
MNAATPFRVGLSRDILDREGRPSFGPGPLAVLDADPRIAWEFVPEPVDEVTPDIMSRYDGLYVNGPRVTAASVARDDLRVKIVARHGVGYDSVDVGRAGTPRRARDQHAGRGAPPGRGGRADLRASRSRAGCCRRTA